MSQAALAQEIFAQPIPDFFPDQLRQACAGKTIQFKLSRAVRDRIQVPEDISISEHAEKYRKVTSIDAYPGDWRNELVPHAKFIMDLICLPSVKEVWLCMCERAAKTNIILNAAQWRIDRGVDSGNVFWLLPNENDAKKAVGERIIPALKASPRMRKFLSKYADDTTRTMIRFRHGPRLFPAWSSAASVSSFFGMLNIADEIDKLELNGAGTETDILTLLEKRGLDRDDSKYLYASTPAGKFIYRGMQSCQVIYVWQVRCPHCGDFVQMDMEHFVIPEGATVESLKNKEHFVKYACNSCGVLWDESDRNSAYLNGRGYAIKGGGVKHPESIGFHGPAWTFPTRKMNKIGSAILKAETGDVNAKKDLAHSYQTVDYEQAKAKDDYNEVLLLCDDRPRDLVPNEAACLILQVDTQQKGFYYELAAVSYADEKGRVKSWLVNKGQLLTFDDLKTFAERTWKSANGREYRIVSALIDSGGTRKAGTPPKHSRTKEVYAFCKANPLFKAVKGTGRKDTPVSYTTIDKWPGTSKPIPGGLNLIKLDVHYYKDELAGRLALNQDDPNAFILYSGFTELQLENPVEGITPQNELTDYAKHLCAEYKDELGNWQHDKKAGRNDWGDCATYRMYHIELVSQWGLLRKKTPKPVQQQAGNKEKKQKQQYRRW